MRVGDDSIGLPRDIDPENPESLGLYLIVALAEQIDGELEIVQAHGPEYIITFHEK